MCCRAHMNINSLRLAPSWINIAWSALQQHVLISDNSRVRKKYFLSIIFVSGHRYFIKLKFRISVDINAFFGVEEKLRFCSCNLTWNILVKKRGYWDIYTNVSLFFLCWHRSCSSPKSSGVTFQLNFGDVAIDVNTKMLFRSVDHF